MNLRRWPGRWIFVLVRSLLLGFISAGFLAGLPPWVGAQDSRDHEHGAGRLGRVSFPVSCAPEARDGFEQAMAVLHSFWWEEGDAAFGRVLDADSSCAMAHWGLAMNAWGNPFA